jgi:hypothetical protein
MQKRGPDRDERKKEKQPQENSPECILNAPEGKIVSEAVTD